MLVVHAGRHKTGTTSLQRFLHDNADDLRSLGLLYPEAARVHSQHLLLANCFQPIYPVPEGSGTDLEPYLQEIRREADTSPDCAVLLSSETFFDLALSGDLDGLRAALADAVGAPEFVLCVRDRHDAAVSALKHEIRLGSVAGRPSVVLARYLDAYARGDRILTERFGALVVDYDEEDSTRAVLTAMADGFGNSCWRAALDLYDRIGDGARPRVNTDDADDAYYCVWTCLYDSLIDVLGEPFVAANTDFPHLVTICCKALGEPAGDGPAFPAFLDLLAQDAAAARDRLSPLLPAGWLTESRDLILRHAPQP